MDKIIEDIKKDYKEGKLIPVIGAGCSTPFGIPDWNGLVKEIANQKLTDDSYKSVIAKEITKGNFFKSLDLLMSEAKMNEFQLQKQVSTIIQKIKSDNANYKLVNSNYSDIADMKFKTIMTFNYDEIIYDFTPIHYYEKPIPIKDFIEPQEIGGDRNIILNLHGYVSNPQTIILSKNSYDNLYNESCPYTELLKVLAGTKKFLFLGTSLTDIYINNTKMIYISFQNMSKKIYL